MTSKIYSRRHSNFFFRENKSWHFMWIICQADSSHEMSRLVFFEKKKIVCCSCDWHLKGLIRGILKVTTICLPNKEGRLTVFAPFLIIPLMYKVFWGVYSFHLSVCLFVHTYIHLIVCLSVTLVDTFASKFIRPYIIKTLWWILSVYGMMLDTGLKFYSAPSPNWGLTLRSRSQTLNFHIKVKII